MRVPVLMSLLIVCMDGGGGGGSAIPQVPLTTPDLYHTAMAKLYKQRCGGDWERMRRLVRAVFTQNQLQRRRQFGHADVVSALQAATAAGDAPDTLDELLELCLNEGLSAYGNGTNASGGSGGIGGEAELLIIIKEGAAITVQAAYRGWKVRNASDLSLAPVMTAQTSEGDCMAADGERAEINRYRDREIL